LRASFGAIFLPFNQNVWQGVDASDRQSRGLRILCSEFQPLFTQSLEEENVMTTRNILFASAVIAAALALQSSAQALTITECSAKYKDAKAAGTLNGATWNDFRKSQCDASGSGSTAKRAPAAGGGTTVVADAVFPSAVDYKYSNERPGRARRKTCLDQYKANKATNANGGLKWLQKGGGYYSQCAKKLKGTA
jgi:hypothetical protein